MLFLFSKCQASGLSHAGAMVGGEERLNVNRQIPSDTHQTPEGKGRAEMGLRKRPGLGTHAQLHWSLARKTAVAGPRGPHGYKPSWWPQGRAGGRDTEFLSSGSPGGSDLTRRPKARSPALSRYCCCLGAACHIGSHQSSSFWQCSCKGDSEDIKSSIKTRQDK